MEMRRSVRLWTLLLSLVLSASLVSCSSFFAKIFEDTDRQKDAGGKSGQKQVTLRLWHIWGTDSDSNRIPFEKTLKQWNDANADIKIEADATENETYKTKIRTAIAVNEAPDIFYSWGAGFAKPFVEAQKILPLDSYLEDGTKEKLLPGTFENFVYGGKTYGLPIYMTAMVFYCNRELFDRNGLKPPESFDELLETVKTFRTAGVTPFAVGQKDRWPIMMYQNILAIRTAGTKLCNQALNRQASFRQPEFVESAVKLNELIKAGAFDKKSIGMTAHEAEREFINGKAAMYFNGSWAVASLEKEDSSVKGKVIARNFPAIGNSNGEPNGFLGGAIDTFMISAATEHREEAVKALKAIGETFCRESYLAGASLPAWKVEVDESRLDPLNVEISALVKESTGFVLAWDTFLSGKDAEIHKDLVGELLAGTKTPGEFAEEMQKLNKK